ncbi:MAG TPA: hypothetical protein ENG51_06260 [Deltaproteobacteria bacterium]|nr:hypothetical protein [Deltaproteobacteria bacterium]
MRVLIIKMWFLIFICHLLFPLSCWAISLNYSGKTIKIRLFRSFELFTQKEITSVAVGESKIVDFVVLDAHHVRLVGKNEGSTNLIISYKEGGYEEYEVLVDKGFNVEVIIGITTVPEFSLKGW